MFFLGHSVQARVSKMTLGIRLNYLYDENKPSHTIRSAKKFEGRDGKTRIPDAFDPILMKVTYTVTSRNQY